MPVYEVRFIAGSGSYATRFTDVEAEIGSSYTIDGRDWVVERLTEPLEPLATAGFVCRAKPSDDPQEPSSRRQRNDP